MTLALGPPGIRGWNSAVGCSTEASGAPRRRPSGLSAARPLPRAAQTVVRQSSTRCRPEELPRAAPARPVSGRRRALPRAAMSSSSSDPTTRSAAPKSSVRVMGPGTATTAMPAARPAATPFGESSSTTQRAGAAPSASAASRNRSGAGLVRELSPPTSSRVTTARNRWRRPSRSRCGTTQSDADDEATAAGTPAASAASSRSATPSQAASPSMTGSRRASRRATRAARSTGRPSCAASCSVQCGWSAVPRIECHHARSSDTPCSAKISTTVS